VRPRKPPEDPQGPPEWVLHYHGPDWTHLVVGEPPPSWYDRAPRSRAQVRGEWRSIQGRHLWSAARAEWAAEHGWSDDDLRTLVVNQIIERRQAAWELRRVVP